MPAKTLWQIILYLSQQTLKTVLLVPAPPPGTNRCPHVLFQALPALLSLHFGIHCYHKWHLGVLHKAVSNNPELLDWHNKRSHEIFMHIIESDRFANRVHTLKIYAPSSGDSDMLWPEISMWGLLNNFTTDKLSFVELLNGALPKLRWLRVLECNGLLLLWCTVKISLAWFLTLRYYDYG